jgi:hypothetical protein
MTEIYGLFDATDPMDPDRVYTSEAFARLFKTMMRDGIVHNDGAELAVSPSVPAAMSVSVGTGMALIQGRYYINDSDLTLNVEAADPSHPRIDRVVVRLEATPGRTVHAVVKKGTPAPSPVPPGLTRTTETWELSLAQVAVGAGATSIIAGNITDERANPSLCGVAAPVYVPSSQLEVVGAVDMQSNALTGLPVPSAATSAARRDMGGVTLQNLGAPVNANDAARKAYVDSAVGGFGISQVTIDANKNWNGKNITNVGSLQTTTGNIGALSQYVDVPGSTLRVSESVSISATKNTWVTVKEYPLPSSYCSVNKSNFTVSVSASISDHRTDQSLGIRVLVGDTGIGAGSSGGYYIGGASCDTTGGIVQGQTLRIQVSWNPGGYAPNATCTVTGVKIRSARSTTVPAYKRFPEGGMW